MSLVTGQAVRTPLGAGVVIEVRNARRVLVQLASRVVSFDVADVVPRPDTGKPTSRKKTRSGMADAPPVSQDVRRTETVDLHGLTVEQALEATMRALDHALRADASELHVIHGHRGTRIRRAVHARLRALPAVRAFRIAPGNEGMTIVQL
jgi:dsDNA-specific endonuclease/ATPase MutS2